MTNPHRESNSDWLGSSTGTALLALLGHLMSGNDEEAWKKFLDRYYRPILHWLRVKGVQLEDAEDITAEILTKVFQTLRRQKYDPARGRFRALLATIARNCWVDFLRKRGRVPDALRPIADISEDEFAGKLEAEWGRTMLELAIERLRAKHTSGAEPDENWQIFEQAKLKDLPYAEIAARRGRTARAVGAVVYRMMGELRKELERVIGEEDR